jgi:hypothetical protein
VARYKLPHQNLVSEFDIYISPKASVNCSEKSRLHKKHTCHGVNTFCMTETDISMQSLLELIFHCFSCDFRKQVDPPSDEARGCQR